MKSQLIFAFIFLLTLPIHGEEQDPVTELKKVFMYAFGGVGIAGSTSDGEKLYKEILARPTAIADFIDVAKKGNSEGKMYAMHALARIAPSQYLELRKSYKLSEKVWTMDGCIMSKKTMKSVLNSIDTRIKDSAQK